MSQLTEDDLQSVYICGTCFGLADRERSDGRNQRCGCGPRNEPTWPGYDFNKRVALCLCCGGEVLRSGHRWAPFFCGTCQLMAMGVSLWFRRLVFPIGRHSLMHTWVPDTPPANLPAHGGDARELAASVHGVLQAVRAGTDVLEAWSARCVAENLERLGLSGGARLVDYLAALEKQSGFSRAAAFADMCEFAREAGRQAGA